MISPRSEFHEATLAVEGEISDINFASASNLHRRWPEHRPIVKDDGASSHIPDRIIIGAAKKYHLHPVKLVIAIQLWGANRNCLFAANGQEPICPIPE